MTTGGDINASGGVPVGPQPVTVPVSQPVQKPWYSSRTIWLAVAMFLASVLSLPQVLAIVPEGLLPYVTAAGAVLAVVLRFRTDQGIGGSQA